MYSYVTHSEVQYSDRIHLGFMNEYLDFFLKINYCFKFFGLFWKVEKFKNEIIKLQH